MPKGDATKISEGKKGGEIVLSHAKSLVPVYLPGSASYGWEVVK